MRKKRYKKILSDILIVVMTATMLPAGNVLSAENTEKILQSQANEQICEESSESLIKAQDLTTSFTNEVMSIQEGIIEGECGEKVSFSLDLQSGTMVISGNGPMGDYDEPSDVPYDEYRDYIQTVEIRDDVTSVGKNCFAFCFGVENVQLPDTLTTIGENAFLGCIHLDMIVIPQNVTGIGDYALGYYCSTGKSGSYEKTGLKILGMADSAAEAYAEKESVLFYTTDVLSGSCGENVTWTLDLVQGVLEISGSGMITDDENSGITPSYGTYESMIKHVVIQEGVTGIGNQAFFYFDRLEDVEIPESVTKIGFGAFNCCFNLSSIEFPKQLKTIGALAFHHCDCLETITIPAAVTSIGSSAFSKCGKLQKIEVEQDNERYMDEKGVLFDKKRDALVAFPYNYQSETFVLPENVKEIDDGAVSGNTYLKSLIYQGDVPNNFSDFYNYMSELTIYYDSSKNDWDELVNSWEENLESNKTLSSYVGGTIYWVDMSERVNYDTLSLLTETTELAVGEQVQMTAKINPFVACEMEWSSSDENVAVVSNHGKVIGCHPGTTEIQVQSADGKYKDKISITVYGEASSLPEYDFQALDDIPETSYQWQYVSEKLNGIFLGNRNSLEFYSFVNHKYEVVKKFKGVSDAYFAENKLYILINEVGYIFDLDTQSLISKIAVTGYQLNTIGADSQGHVYFGGRSRLNSVGNDILLYTEEGTLLSKLAVGTAIYAFSGFDATNGSFYMQSFGDFRYWGADHPGNVLTMGMLKNNRLTYIDTHHTFNIGYFQINMDCLDYLYQFTSKKSCVELLGGRYLVSSSELKRNVSVYDSNAASGKQPDMIFYRMAETEEESSIYDNESIGVRAVYNENNNSIIVYENKNMISEYSMDTKEKISTIQTKYHVYSLRQIGAYVIAIEKNDDAFYMEIFNWAQPEQLEIKAEQMTMKVGGVQTLSLISGRNYQMMCDWSSSDESIISVSKSGKISAWKEGKAVITATVLGNMRVDITITVTADTMISTDNIVPLVGTMSNNVSCNNYSVYGKVVNSYLYENEDQTLTRVEKIETDEILIEQYSSEYELMSAKRLTMETDLFGGFFAGKDANYLVFGQSNLEESDDAEVLRVVKYSKEWKRLGQVSIEGANTYIPFEAGTLRMTETADGLLYLYTCHQMYARSDGLHHQANMIYVVNEQEMIVEQSYYDVMNISQAGYVSHSFNQFVQTDGKYVFRVDHGDANPRAVSLIRNDVEGDVTDVCYTLPLSINGYSGTNATGVSVGGMELSSDNCLIVGNSVDQSDKNTYSANGQRNIFLTVTDKQLNSTRTVWLTDYDSEENINPYTPHIVKLNDEQFLILWEEYRGETGKIVTKMATVNSRGDIISGIVEKNLRLSDCKPIRTSDGLVKWYVTTGNVKAFCVLNPYHLSAIQGEVEPTTSNEKETTTSYEVTTTMNVEEVTTKDTSIEKNTSGEVETTTMKTEGGTTVNNEEEASAVPTEESATNIQQVTADNQKESFSKDNSVKIKNNHITSENINVTHNNDITTAAKQPSKPKNVKVTNKKVKKIRVTWKKTANAKKYQVQWSTTKKFKAKKTNSKNVKKAIITIQKLKGKKLTKGTKYYVRVRAINGTKKSAWSKVKIITVKK